MCVCAGRRFCKDDNVNTNINYKERKKGTKDTKKMIFFCETLTRASDEKKHSIFYIRLKDFESLGND